MPGDSSGSPSGAGMARQQVSRQATARQCLPLIPAIRGVLLPRFFCGVQSRKSAPRSNRDAVALTRAHNEAGNNQLCRAQNDEPTRFLRALNSCNRVRTEDLLGRQPRPHIHVGFSSPCACTGERGAAYRACQNKNTAEQSQGGRWWVRVTSWIRPVQVHDTRPPE